MKSKLLTYIQRYIIEFFILIFVIGFFSQSAANLLLPQVQSQVLDPGKVVNTTIHIPGEIVSKTTHYVRLSEPVVVQEVIAKMGQTVKAGDPLFRIDTAYSHPNQEGDASDVALKVEGLQAQKQQLLAGKTQQSASHQALLKQVETAKANLAQQEALLASGAISASQFDQAKQAYDGLVASVNASSSSLSAKASDVSHQLKSLDQQIEALLKQEAQGFYASVDESGICYAPSRGVVVKLPQAQQVVGKDQTLAQTAMSTNYEEVYFVGQVAIEDANKINVGDVLSIDIPGTRKSKKVKVISKNSVAQDNAIEINCDFVIETLVGETPILGTKMKAKSLSQIPQVQDDPKQVVPKEAVVVYGPLEMGAEGYMFVIKEVEGLLGSKFQAEQVFVTIADIGDAYVTINEAMDYSGSHVITNVDYKIRNGVTLNWHD